MSTSYEKVSPAEILARVQAGREVLLWDHDGDHSKVLGVAPNGNTHLGIDSANTTIRFAGALTGRECRLHVHDHAMIRVAR